MADKPKLSEEQKQKLKKYVIFTLMTIICAGCMWLIFAPSEDEKAKEQIGMGFNADIPDPKGSGIIGDKKDAYEQEQMQLRQKERMQSLQGYADMLENSKSEKVTLTLPDEPKVNKAPISNSVSAYKDINRTLGNFYENPKDDPEKEEKKRKLEELEAKMQEKEDKQSAIDEQLVLMEKYYEMAAKYMPQSQNQGEPFSGNNNSLKSKIDNYSNNSSSNGKTKVSPVRQIQKQAVSTLGQNLSNDELLYLYDQPRNFGFNAMDAQIGANEKNTISAVIIDHYTSVGWIVGAGNKKMKDWQASVRTWEKTTLIAGNPLSVIIRSYQRLTKSIKREIKKKP